MNTTTVFYEAKYYDYAPGKQPISETRKAYRYDSKGNAISVVVENQKEKYVIEYEIQYDRPDNSLSELPLNALEQVSVNNNPVTSAETMPTFRSGDIKVFAQWCAQNVRYPQTAIDNGYQGKVMIQFIVERDGSVSHVTVLQGANQVLNQEAIRVVQSSLKWSPGMNGRVPVRIRHLPLLDPFYPADGIGLQSQIELCSTTGVREVLVPYRPSQKPENDLRWFQGIQWNPDSKRIYLPPRRSSIATW